MTLNSILDVDIYSTLLTTLIPGSTYCIGVSGGADSMMLSRQVDIFVKTLYRHCKITLIVCYFDHGVRDGSVEGALIHQGLGHHTVEVGSYNGSRYDESALRDARYTWFSKMYTKHNASGILLGHTLTDRMEGSLLSMIGGGTIGGIIGLEEKSSRLGMNIIRPLIRYTKGQVYSVAKQLGVVRNEDPTNIDPLISKRNEIRAMIQTTHPGLYIGTNVDKNLYNFYSVYTEKCRNVIFNRLSWVVNNKKVTVYSCLVCNDSEIQSFATQIGMFGLSLGQRKQVLQLIATGSGWFSAKGWTFVTRDGLLYCRSGTRTDIVATTSAIGQNGSIQIQYYTHGLVVNGMRMSRIVKKLPIPYFLRQSTILFHQDGKILSYETLDW